MLQQMLAVSADLFDVLFESTVAATFKVFAFCYVTKSHANMLFSTLKQNVRIFSMSETLV